jgi:hypothetical protein
MANGLSAGQSGEIYALRQMTKSVIIIHARARFGLLLSKHGQAGS